MVLHRHQIFAAINKLFEHFRFFHKKKKKFSLKLFIDPISVIALGWCYIKPNKKNAKKKRFS